MNNLKNILVNNIIYIDEINVYELNLKTINKLRNKLNINEINLKK